MERDDLYSPFMQYNEVLVTGGTGFLGRAVCRALVSRGHLPRLLVRPGSEEKIPGDVRQRCRVTLGDIDDRDSVANAAQGTGAIVHLAGIRREAPKEGETFDRMHVRAAWNVVLAAREWRIGRLIHVSALGARPGDPSPFLDSKGCGEEIVQTSGLRWTVFRPPVIFGEGDEFLGALAQCVRRSRFLPVPGRGRVQPVHVDDLAKAIVDSLSRPETEGRAYDAGGPDRIAVEALLDAIASATGRTVTQFRVPRPFARSTSRRLFRFAGVPDPPPVADLLDREIVCDEGPFREAFGLPLLRPTDYLAASGGRRLVPMTPAGRRAAPERHGEGLPGTEAAGESPYRKSA